MGYLARLNRFRRKEEKVEAAARQLFGIDPYGPTPIGLRYDVAVGLPHDHAHIHYGVYTETTGQWPNLNFTRWYDCGVCGRLS